MLLRPTNRKAAAAAALLLALTACQQPQPVPSPPTPQKIKYSPTYDKEIQEIMELARLNHWEEAQAKTTALYNKDPKNAILARLYSWVTQQAQQIREQALEDKIRSIDSKNSAFSPTIPSLLKEQRDRGLPPRKDIRDAVDKIENSRWIPESYGKVIHEQAPLFDFESAKGKMARVLEKEVTVHMDNVPLENILIYLSQNSGVNIVADKTLPALKQMLSVNLDKVKLSEFLRYVGRNYELQFQVGDDLVWVTDGKDPKKLMEETRFYRLRKGFIMPAEFGASEVVKTTTMANNQITGITETQKINKFVNDLAPTMTSLEKTIKELWASGTNTTKYLIDYERNLVVARGTAEELNTLEKIIQEFDRPIQQVLIEARFVTVSKPAFLQLGVLWETGRQLQSPRNPQDFTGLLNSQQGAALGIGIQETFTNVLGASDLSATISALEQSGESQTLSAPRLVVLNNRPANISDGKVQYYYEQYDVKSTVQQYYTSSSFVPSGKPTKITGGAELDVLASISGDGKSIVLALHPRVNTDVQLVTYATLSDYDATGKLQSTFNINLPQYRTEELATRMVVKSGETVVMGGVLERQRASYVESIPVLGDIPIIGALFRRRTEQDTPRYLLVFVTATIVKDTGEYLVYDENPGTTNVALSASSLPAAGPASGQPNPGLTGTNAIPAALTSTTNAVPPAVAVPPVTNSAPAAGSSLPNSTNAVAPPK